MSVSRRTFIASSLGIASASVSSLRAEVTSGAQLYAIADGNFEAGRRLFSLLASQKRLVLEPKGEIVRLLRDKAATWAPPSTLIGCTSHSDYEIVTSFLRCGDGKITHAGLCGPDRQHDLEGSLSVAPAALRNLYAYLQNIQSSTSRSCVLWMATFTAQPDTDKQARFIV